MTEVSARTAELALVALGATLRRAGARVNGRELPADVRRAFTELHAATRTEIDLGPTPVPPSELIDATTAARRLGLSVRAVQKQCADGRLPATRNGRRTWLIRWTEEHPWQQPHRPATRSPRRA